MKAIQAGIGSGPSAGAAATVKSDGAPRARKITLYIAASLDGFIARRDGSIDWLPTEAGPEDYGYQEFLAGIDTVVMGRKTYDLARRRDGPEPFAGRRGVVFSRRRAGQRDGRTRFIGDDPADTVRELRMKRGRGIWLVGGGEIARECLEAGLVNEVVLTLVPVLLGDGLPLFLPRAGTTWLHLRGSRSFPNGLVQLTYETRRPERPPAKNEPTEMPVKTEDETRVATAAVGVELIRAWSARHWAA